MLWFVLDNLQVVSTHSRTEAAAQNLILLFNNLEVSTHSRTEAAAMDKSGSTEDFAFQHTAARRRLQIISLSLKITPLFQHTAARRRLLPT